MNTVLLIEASGMQFTSKVGSVQLEQSSDSQRFKLYRVYTEESNSMIELMTRDIGLLFFIVSVLCLAEEGGENTLSKTGKQME